MECRLVRMPLNLVPSLLQPCQETAMKQTPGVPIRQEAGWVPQPVWMLWTTENLLPLPLPPIERLMLVRPDPHQTLYRLSHPGSRKPISDITIVLGEIKRGGCELHETAPGSRPTAGLAADCLKPMFCYFKFIQVSATNLRKVAVYLTSFSSSTNLYETTNFIRSECRPSQRPSHHLNSCLRLEVGSHTSTFIIKSPDVGAA
jgi:hypothetical protein